MIKVVDVVGTVLVVGVVAAILFPVFAKVRTTNNRFTCASNMKQLGLAMMQYEQDYDGEMPRLDDGTAAGTWKTFMYPYIKSHDVYACPQREPKPPIGRDGFPISFAANTAGVHTTGGPHGPFAPWAYPVHIGDIAHPGWTIALCEVQNTGSPGFDIDDPFFGPEHGTLFAGHTGGGSYLFVDGHVKHLKPAETITSSAADGGMPINYWYGSRQPLSANGQAILKTATPTQ